MLKCDYSTCTIADNHRQSFTRIKNYQGRYMHDTHFVLLDKIAFGRGTLLFASQRNATIGEMIDRE